MYRMSDKKKPDDEIFNIIHKIPITKADNWWDETVVNMTTKIKDTTDDKEKEKLTHELKEFIKRARKSDLDGGKRKRRTKRKRRSRRHRRTIKAK